MILIIFATVLTQETPNRRQGKKTKLHNVPHLQKRLLDLNSKGPKCLDAIRATQLAVKLNRMCACRFEDLHTSTSFSVRSHRDGKAAWWETKMTFCQAQQDSGQKAKYLMKPRTQLVG